MGYVTVKNDIVDLLCKANPNVNIIDDNIDMFTPACGITPRDLIFVSMELKHKYKIDYNKLVEEVKIFSLKNFTNALLSQIE